MTTNKQPITERIAARLDAFNRRLEARLRRNQELLENMRAEEDLGRGISCFAGIGIVIVCQLKMARLHINDFIIQNDALIDLP